MCVVIISHFHDLLRLMTNNSVEYVAYAGYAITNLLRGNVANIS